MAPKKVSKEKVSSQNFFGLPLQTWISSLAFTAKAQMPREKVGVVIFIGQSGPSVDVAKIVKNYLMPWQLKQLESSKSESLSWTGRFGPIWIFRSLSGSSLSHESAHARARDCFGSVVSSLQNYNLEQLIFEFHGTSLEEEKAALLGLEMGSYFYSENCGNPRKSRRSLPALKVREDKTQLTKTDIKASSDLALSLNLSRHLVNLPAGILNTRAYADGALKLLASQADTKVEIWEGDKLDKEKMGLLKAVGQGAAEGPRLVCIHYRPSGMPAQTKPIAFVGKGIVFDTGGLDLKPSSGMRWMKKDMGGSAAVLALAFWATRSGLQQPCDFYLALAENSIGERAFRPGDIVTARNGLTVEIHNTDAEGRLVLADALDVAVTRQQKPSSVINVATLTGAIKVGLGAEIAGLFCNQDELADRLLDCAWQKGDLAWRMPLHKPYKSMLRSNFADMLNASDGFAGAITAALFLQEFVGSIPWAHFDIYAWRDSASGACSEAGGNGQCVQALTEFLARAAVPQATSALSEGPSEQPTSVRTRATQKPRLLARKKK
jgi:leucyl aminopeptidase